MIDTKQYAEFAEQEIKHICGTFGKREPGSAAETEAQEYMAKMVKDNGWADKVELQDFKVHPRAMLVFTKIMPISMFAGILLFLVHPISIIAAVLLSVFAFVTHMFLYVQTFGIFFKKRTSKNLYAVKSPTGEVKRRIIFGGHTDSAYEFGLAHKYGQKKSKLLMYFGVAGIALSLIFGLVYSIFYMVSDFERFSLFTWLFFGVMLLFSPFYVLLLFFVRYKVVVDGANDNLSATFVSMAVLKYMKENNISYENTEVMFFTSGSEEAGLRGAKAFVKQNKDMLKDPNVETVFIALETLREVEHLEVLTRDLNGIVKLDPRAVKLIEKAAEGHIELGHGTVPLGATDAAAFAKGGIPAVAILAMDHTPAQFYHTRLDNADNLSVECMQKTLDLSLSALEIFDKNGLS